MNETPTQNYCGFVAIVGRPNVGKSTLMNHIIGQKISITSRKPQTTQRRINGVLTKENYQYIFVDTPGFQKLYINKFNELLNTSVIKSLTEVEVILFIVEAGIFNAGDEAVLNLIPQSANVILVVNKQDRVKDKYELNSFIKSIATKYPFKASLTTSSKHHLGIDEVTQALKPFLPQTPFLYPFDQLTDKSSNFLTSEIIREKLFRYLGDELPYNLAVTIDSYTTSKDLVKISATIMVDRENQKGMIIGKGGEKLKKISTEARIDIEQLINSKVFLQVWVTVKNGFADEAKFLQQFE